MQQTKTLFVVVMKPTLDYGAPLILVFVSADAVNQTMFSTDTPGPKTLQ
jgi:hypothetical protein